MRKIVFILGILVIISVLGFALNLTFANSTDTTLNSQGDWEAGASSNIDSTSTPGRIKLPALPVVPTTHTSYDSLGNLYPLPCTVVTVELTFDQDIATNCGTGEFYIEEDFDSAIEITQLKVYRSDDPLLPAPVFVNVEVWNGTGWDPVVAYNTKNPGVWETYDFPSPYSTTKWRIFKATDVYLGEMQVTYGSSTGTNTTAASQIGNQADADRYATAYQTFNATYTKPVNTSVAFRFRLIDCDGTDAGTWTASQTPATGVDLDLTALADLAISGQANRCLQVESTLSTTDNSVTPELQSYTVSYHSNKKPNTPTAQ